MGMTTIAAGGNHGIPVELYQDRFSGQYAVDAGGVPVYDSCDQSKAQGVYEFLLGLDSDVLAGEINSVRASGYDASDARSLERLAGARR